MLGISIRFCSFEGANENVWHILEVQSNSPAEAAGLRAFTDFIIGADSVMHESEDLFTLVEAHEGRPLKLYVYNTETDHCREVLIKIRVFAKQMNTINIFHRLTLLPMELGEAKGASVAGSVMDIYTESHWRTSLHHPNQCPNKRSLMAV